ncbi:MAG: protein kinase, partial [Pyrinomonadaceae bacterium]
MSDEKAENLKIGKLFGHYRIVKQIGAGGIGEVYLAEDTSLDRKVAIKFLREEYSRNTDKLNRFIQEAKAVSALNHPNILTVFEIGKIEDENYIVTEFIKGETLRERYSPHEPLSLRNILKISIQVCEALSSAHEAGIVHRDIKPENIMIRADGYAKVLDFGLAKLTERKDSENISSESVTKAFADTVPGMIMGTVSYMSPEQARGKPTDARTDIWSFGVTLFEMLANKLPFQGETINHTVVAILEEDPLLPENIPAELQRIVRKSLCKDKEMRYQSAKDLMIDLENLRRSLDTQGEPSRSSSPNSEAVTDDFHDQSTVVYSGQPIEQTKGSDRKARTTVGIDSDERSNYWKAVVLVFAIALIASAAWWLAGGTTKDQPSTGLLKSVGITSWSSGPNELIVEASFSPDAKMVAFGSARSGATEIWVKPTVGGEPIQVTKNGFYNQYPIWSADGQQIAYFSKRGNKGGIWRVSFTGGEQSEVVGDIDFAAKPRYWAKSGRIYFQQRYDIFAVDVKSGEIKQITDFEAKNLKPRSIEISADESKVAFSIKENDVFKVKVEQLNSGQFDEIAVSKNQIDYLAWHPNGRDVLFSATFEGIYHIFKT